ncbi:DUF1129 domain-containing protein [Halalkalibacillus sediminis]|uniref:DUF1129 domain-containing protein n=1 Tax=Halalkalibacillus sediminis TaxID=2018042 RepID=A0A2I0QUL1_9BACI|nr:DUF1129 family protein [Halalkalibacillus sediminis]PKR78035.1 DUF1129 domain-containing protein [Halalkalibacillus sediminis]
MNAKELIEQNNTKREQLNKENLEYYENMLVYIRLQGNKSELATEEILDELLNHLLDAQAEGKTAYEVFGDAPKSYADELIGEIQPMFTKERFELFSMGIFMFAGWALLAAGILNPLLNWLLGFGSVTSTISIGYATIVSLLSVLLALAVCFAFLWYMRWSAFKKFNKILEFFILWITFMLMTGGFMAVIYFTPSFGPSFTIPTYYLAILGAILIIPATYLTKKSR